MPKTYEKYRLSCGHDGNIVWRGDGKIGVRGTNRNCAVCYASRKKGKTPTVHIIDEYEDARGSVNE